MVQRIIAGSRTFINTGITADSADNQQDLLRKRYADDKGEDNENKPLDYSDK